MSGDRAWHALERYKQLVDDLPCECDDYEGYTCTIHSHRRVARDGLRDLSVLFQEIDREGAVGG